MLCRFRDPKRSAFVASVAPCALNVVSLERCGSTENGRVRGIQPWLIVSLPRR